MIRAIVGGVALAIQYVQVLTYQIAPVSTSDDEMDKSGCLIPLITSQECLFYLLVNTYTKANRGLGTSGGFLLGADFSHNEKPCLLLPSWGTISDC